MLNNCFVLFPGIKHVIVSYYMWGVDLIDIDISDDNLDGVILDTYFSSNWQPKKMQLCTLTKTFPTIKR